MAKTTARAKSSKKVRFVPMPGQTKGKLGEVLPIPRPLYRPTTEPD